MRRRQIGAGLIATFVAGGCGQPPDIVDPGTFTRELKPLVVAYERRSRAVLNISDAYYGFEPWTTDGTPEGTWLLADTIPGPSFAGAAEFTPVGSHIFFAAHSPTRQLWRSDGTRFGATKIKDFGPPLPPTTFTEVSHLTALDDRLVFTVTSPGGHEVWTSDGTEWGTRRVELRSGLRGHVRSILGCGGSAFFSLQLPVGGVALIESDGTRPGTLELFRHAETFSLQRAGRRVMLGALHDLLAVESGQPGATLVHSFNRGRELQGDMVRAGDEVVFTVWDTLMGIDAGSQLWRSDGTPEGSRLVRDFERALIHPKTLTVARDRVFFVTSPWPAGHPLSPMTLWSSDGTEAGTVPITRLPTGVVTDAVGTPGGLFLAIVRPSSSSTGPASGELWFSDGTSQGTSLVLADVLIFPPQRVQNIIVFFTIGITRPTIRLWRSDGTRQGTWVLRLFSSQASAPPQLDPAPAVQP